MKDISEPLYLDVTADGAHSPSPAYPFQAHEPFENHIGDRELGASSQAEPTRARVSYVSFVSYFPSPKAPLDIELTILTNNQGYATKVFTLNENGELSKRSAANIYEGQAERVAIANLAELRDLIGRLQPKQALCFGVSKTEAGSPAHAGDASFRFLSGRHCARPGPLFLSARSARHPDARLRSPTRAARLAAGRKLMRSSPKLSRRGARRSGCGGLHHRPTSIERDGTELIGMGGWRCYVAVDDASAIPSVGAYIYQRLWETRSWLHLRLKVRTTPRPQLDRCLCMATRARGLRSGAGP